MKEDTYSNEWDGVPINNAPLPPLENTADQLAAVQPATAGSLKAAPLPTWKVRTIPASAIKPVAINWAWPGWLALGKLTVLAGAGGTGKTTLSLSLIATLTAGGRWPDGENNRQTRSALIWSSEDDPADTIVPRLIAAGADLARVHFIDCRVNDQGEREPFDPAKDIKLLRTRLEELGDVGLIMLDPIVSVVIGDMHKANDVRRALQGLVDLAEEFDCAILGITHFSKGSAASNPADRVIGSQAFGALARTVLVAAKQEDSEQRVLARAKSNIAVDSGGCTYEILETSLDGGIAATVVQWGEVIEGTARDILASVESVGGDDQDGDDPVSFLRQVLSAGQLSAKEATKAMTDNGYSTKQIRNARKKLNVTIERSGFGKGSASMWSLPTWQEEDA